VDVVAKVLIVVVGVGAVLLVSAAKRRCPKCGSLAADKTGGRETGRFGPTLMGLGRSGLRAGSDGANGREYEFTCSACRHVWRGEK
jgi:hypothetical protein